VLWGQPSAKAARVSTKPSPGEASRRAAAGVPSERPRPRFALATAQPSSASPGEGLESPERADPRGRSADKRGEEGGVGSSGRWGPDPGSRESIQSGTGSSRRKRQQAVDDIKAMLQANPAFARKPPPSRGDYRLSRQLPIKTGIQNPVSTSILPPTSPPPSSFYWHPDKLPWPIGVAWVLPLIVQASKVCAGRILPCHV